MNKTLKLVLVVSLALNVLLAGVMIGKFAHHMGKDRNDQLVRLVENADLAESTRADLLRRMETAFAANKETRDASRASREEALALLTAEKFNAEAYRRALIKMFDAQQGGRRQMADILADVAAELSQEDRKKMAEEFRHRRR